MKLNRLKLISGSNLPETPDPKSLGRMAVLMSGGVDSSVTALKLKDDGWEVVGVNMRIPLACGGGEVECAGIEEVAKHLDIPLYQVDLTETFQTEVIDYFEDEYKKGRTPNPCCDCNRRLKFGAVWDIIEEELGIENVATGHYARVVRQGDIAYIARGADENKDQSYFIYGIPAKRLQHFYLPLGDINKDETRRFAAKAKLTVAQKSESMDLCFAGGGDYREAFSNKEEDIEGDFVDTEFNIIGKHTGVRNYTVGQRKLGASFGPEPSYAIKVIPESNQVMVGTRKDAYKDRVEAELVTVHQPDKLLLGASLLGKIRSAGSLLECKIDEINGHRVSVIFSKELFAPTPGQHLVLYANDSTIIAGGTII